MYVNLLQAFSLSHLQKSVKMCIVAVNAAIGKKSHEMNGGIIVPGILHSCQKSFILKEIPVVDLFCDPGKLLIYDAACAHIHMAYFRVAHLALRKSYSQSAGVAFHERTLCHQFIHDRSLRLVNSVSVMSFIQSVTVKNH